LLLGLRPVAVLGLLMCRLGLVDGAPSAGGVRGESRRRIGAGTFTRDARLGRGC